MQSLDSPNTFWILSVLCPGVLLLKFKISQCFYPPTPAPLQNTPPQLLTAVPRPSYDILSLHYAIGMHRFSHMMSTGPLTSTSLVQHSTNFIPTSATFALILPYSALLELFSHPQDFNPCLQVLFFFVFPTPWGLVDMKLKKTGGWSVS